MHFRGFLSFNQWKRCALLSFLILGKILYASSGLTVLSLPEDPVNGWFMSSPSDISGAASFPVFLPEKMVSLKGMHGFWMFDTPYTRITAGNQKFFGGASFLKTEGIDIRTDVASDDPIGETAYYNGTFFVGKEWKISPDVRVGTTVHFVFERLYYASAMGGALNVAGAWRMNPYNNFFVGVRNLGKMQNLYKIATPLPLDIYSGFSAEIKGFHAGLAIHADESAEIYGTGFMKYQKDGLFSLALSYSGLNNSWHLGGDLHYKQVTVGMGQFFMQDHIAYPLMISIGYSKR
ncbi:MAG: hypothetical protein PHE86_00415 [Candidatus Marinimicrobia bacterium]|nr:hypothetical protein [Candidatus Neomarinimicrobiota bacterium]MDD5582006.1 hypothetical protein [Candidatus Neomarinimicrobiota bacterium]